MGFQNAVYNNTVTSLTQGQVNRLANPYYKWLNQKPQIVTYWNINTKHTTLDAGTKDGFDQLGSKSPFRYNRVKNFVLYGISNTQVDLQLQEYGVESSEIGGECLILPKTIIPQPNDYFQLDYLQDKPYLFRIVQVTIDNLETPGGGYNFYKCSYVLDATRSDWVEYLNGRQLIKKLVFRMENVGTNTTAIISEEDDKFLSKLNSLYSTLGKYYKELFWRSNIQTFVCGYINGIYFYDPYLLEFMIRNALFASTDEMEYLYLEQAVHTSSTFLLEYDKTIFSDLEKRTNQLHTNSFYLVPVHDPNSLLIDRMEDYFQLSNAIEHKHSSQPVNNIHNSLFANIQENTPFDEKDTANHVLYWNIIVNFLNKTSDAFEITEAEMYSLMNIRYRYCKDLFYEIPILMYIIKTYINDIQAVNETPADDESIEGMENCFNVRK